MSGKHRRRKRKSKPVKIKSDQVRSYFTQYQANNSSCLLGLIRDAHSLSPDDSLLLRETSLLDLRSTQVTIGFREVAYKRLCWRALHGNKIEEFLARHVIPVVKGPKDRLYVVDHHHLCRSLVEEAVEIVFSIAIADLSHLDRSAFWYQMELNHWVHPYDLSGKRCSYSEIPKRIIDLVDDPYRSLASALRRAGGYAKARTPYSEFAWADFFRSRIDSKTIEKHFNKALEEARILAQSKETIGLPGWCGSE